MAQIIQVQFEAGLSEGTAILHATWNNLPDEWAYQARKASGACRFPPR